MARRTLTDRLLKSLKPGGDEIADAVVPGMNARPLKTGVSFVLVKRFPGFKQPARRSLGIYPGTTLAAARDKARKWIELIGKGIDPAVEVKAEREANRERQLNTFGTIAESFIAKHVSTKRTAVMIEQRIRNKMISAWEKRPVDTLGRRDIITLIENDLADAGPSSARQTFVYLKRLFKWMAARDLIKVNPCAAISAADFLPAKVSRDRVLSDHELKLLLKATAPDAGVGYPDAAMFRLLLLTGTRREEAAGASWLEISEDMTTWTLPAPRVKNKCEFLIPLSPQAVSLLTSIPKIAGSYLLFPSTKGGQGHIRGFGHRKDRLDERIAALNGGVAIPGWTIHDLRRSMASTLGALGVSPHVIEACLNHKSGVVSGIAATYNRFDYRAEKTHALALWANYLDKLEHGAAVDNVVPMLRR